MHEFETIRHDHGRLVESFRDERGLPPEWVNGIGLSNAASARQFYANQAMHAEDLALLNSLPEEQPVILFGVQPGMVAAAHPVIQQAVSQLGLGTPVLTHERAPASALKHKSGKTKPTSTPSTPPTPAPTTPADSSPPATSTDAVPPDASHRGGFGKALAVGLGAVGVVGLGVYLFKRNSDKYALVEDES